MSMGISIGGNLFSSFLSAIGLDFSVSTETSTETSNTTAWSVSYTMGPSPGTEGYATFQPKYTCKFSPLCLPLFPDTTTSVPQRTCYANMKLPTNRHPGRVRRR